VYLLFINEHSSDKNILFLSGLSLLFCSLVFPTSYQFIKIFLLVLAFVGVLIWYSSIKIIPLKKEIILFVLFITISSGFFILLGALRGEQGAYRVVTVYLIWPFVYLFIFSIIVYKQFLFKLFKVFIVSLLIISIYSFTYIGYALNLLPSLFYIEFDLGQSIGFYDGFMEYSIYSLSSFLFLIPFAISGLVIWDDSFYKKIRISKKIMLITLGISLFSAVLSGRRALWLVVVLSVFITFFLYLLIVKTKRLHIIKKLIKYLLFFVVIGLLMLPFINNTINLNLDSLLDKFNFEAGYERSMQFQALIKGWIERPFIGHGHGAVAEVIRSQEMPWAYELQYVDLLFKTGIIGFLIYSLSGFWIILKLIKIAKKIPESRMIIIPILTGVISFLVANTTNPYLLKFDYIWILILPLGIINLYTMSENVKGD
jgi:hypothetical protein